MKQTEFTPAEKLGLVVGSFAVYTNATKSNYTINPVIKMSEDDGTDMPMYSCIFRGYTSFIEDDDWMWLEINDISNYFSDNKNPQENELILLALDLGVSVESLKEQIKLLNNSSEED